ncbi:MAG: pyridoxal-dependent decarboxylase, exosortase A system-associated [Pseudomonadales bacterium]|nr:pyridoxal-dependent decarboxylase, exosortase A system-associated [Pseudomonadales bacterium]MCP5302897.1 pyridoxal-dependent decarboxylase, exosortase A system-associated [Pseudomonadales bacterium]
MNKPKPQHVPMDQFKTDQNCLLINGRSVMDLAEQLGSTPFYAYDSSLMTARVQQLREVLPKEIHLHYAMKANPMMAVVEHMAKLVDGLDVASQGELEIALQTSTLPKNISFAGPGKRDPELVAAIEAGITINVESEGELRRIDKIATKLGVRPQIAIRVNPDFELKSSGMKMGGGPKQFGIDAERVPTVLTLLGDMDCHFRGFHIFSGSQNLRSEAIIEAHDKTFELAIRLAESAPSEVELLNIGGGFGIPYFPGETQLDLQPIADNLQRTLPKVINALPGAEIVTELGRYLVGEAGVYICKIIDKKISRGHTFLITDGGLHHHLSASGNFGQVIRKNYPVAVANRMSSDNKELVSVVGPLCTPLDLLADKVELPSAEPDDLVAVFQSGAYGFSASPQGFLSHPGAKEILV